MLCYIILCRFYLNDFKKISTVMVCTIDLHQIHRYSWSNRYGQKVVPVQLEYSVQALLSAVPMYLARNILVFPFAVLSIGIDTTYSSIWYAPRRYTENPLIIHGFSQWTQERKCVYYPQIFSVYSFGTYHLWAKKPTKWTLLWRQSYPWWQKISKSLKEKILQ